MSLSTLNPPLTALEDLIKLTPRPPQLIHGWLRLNPTLVLMQYGAPGHRAAETIQELHKRNIYPTF
jgi:hypothetical protein